MSNRVDGFVFNAEATTTFEWPVRLTPPGGADSHRVIMTFETVSMDELKELEELAQDDGEANAIVKRVVKGWASNEKAAIRDTDNQILPCNDETKHALFNQMWITKQTMSAFMESMGGKKARTKN